MSHLGWLQSFAVEMASTQVKDQGAAVPP